MARIVQHHRNRDSTLLLVVLIFAEVMSANRSGYIASFYWWRYPEQRCCRAKSIWRNGRTKPRWCPPATRTLQATPDNSPVMNRGYPSTGEAATDDYYLTGPDYDVGIGTCYRSTSRDGLKVADDSIWRFSYYVLQYIRMPLFAVIPGFVYAYKSVSRFASNSKFIARKINRLLIPLVVVTTLFYLLQYTSLVFCLLKINSPSVHLFPTAYTKVKRVTFLFHLYKKRKKFIIILMFC